ncbi:MAG: ArsR/SmtB family transcription factor [Stellaceae bacterium]
MEQLLSVLRATAEPTRLRLLALCAQSELTVSELTEILGQSQPRVSRHLKLMCEAGLLDRFREANWVFHRLARSGPGGALARRLVELVPEDDPLVALDRERLERVKRTRATAAEAYFRANARQWDKIRSLYIDEREVEATLIDRLTAEPIDDLLDIGTGTGRILEVMSVHVGSAIGVDLSRDMLAIARVNLERAGAQNCIIRQGDMYQLPLPGKSFDAVVIHQVLHYAERPSGAVAEAARVLRPGGRLAICDFAPHELEFLRTEHAHRRLGFADHEITLWCREAGLEPETPIHLPGEKLTVALWLARRPGGPAVHDRTRGFVGAV